MEKTTIPEELLEKSQQKKNITNQLQEKVLCSDKITLIINMIKAYKISSKISYFKIFQCNSHFLLWNLIRYYVLEQQVLFVLSWIIGYQILVSIQENTYRQA